MMQRYCMHTTRSCCGWQHTSISTSPQQSAVYHDGHRSSNKQCRFRSRVQATPVRQQSDTAVDTGTGAASNSSRSVQLVEFHDHHKTTYRWSDTDSVASNGASSSSSSQPSAGVSVHDERYETEQDEKSIFSSVAGGQQLLDSIKSLYLPAGYPNSVTDDYLVGHAGMAAMLVTSLIWRPEEGHCRIMSLESCCTGISSTCTMSLISKRTHLPASAPDSLCRVPPCTAVWS